MNKLLIALFGLPKSVFVNFKCLPLRKAVRLPVLVSPNTRLKSLKGRIEITAPLRTGMIKVGFAGAGTSLHISSVIENNGLIRFEGICGIGGGGTTFLQ